LVYLVVWFPKDALQDKWLGHRTLEFEVATTKHCFNHTGCYIFGVARAQKKIVSYVFRKEIQKMSTALAFATVAE
jgi:hypothetical protein